MSASACQQSRYAGIWVAPVCCLLANDSGMLGIWVALVCCLDVGFATLSVLLCKHMPGQPTSLLATLVSLFGSSLQACAGVQGMLDT